MTYVLAAASKEEAMSQDDSNAQAVLPELISIDAAEDEAIEFEPVRLDLKARIVDL